MTAEAAWDYAIGMIKVDGLEPHTSGLRLQHIVQYSMIWVIYPKKIPGEDNQRFAERRIRSLPA